MLLSCKEERYNHQTPTSENKRVNISHCNQSNVINHRCVNPLMSHYIFSYIHIGIYTDTHLRIYTGTHIRIYTGTHIRIYTGIYV